MINLAKIKAICAKYDIRPSKSKGQNFLTDQSVVDRIIAAADIKAGETVLEVGPGLGVLTGELGKRAGRIVAVELDRQALEFLHAEFFSYGNLELIEKDVLRLNRTEVGLSDFGYKVVSNLPYNITSKFLRLFIEQSPRPSEMVLMVQKEVAQRIVAESGEMSLLSLACQFYADCGMLFEVTRDRFWPAPAVDSVVIRLKLKENLPDVDVREMFRLARIGFASRRKQLHNNLASGLKISSGEAKEALKSLGLDEKIRAQDLSVDDWMALVEKKL